MVGLELFLPNFQETEFIPAALTYSRCQSSQLCSALPWNTGGFCFLSPDWLGKDPPLPTVLLPGLRSCKVRHTSSQLIHDLLPQGRATVLHPEPQALWLSPAPHARFKLFPQGLMVCVEGLPSSGLPTQFTRLSWAELNPSCPTVAVLSLEIIFLPLCKVMGANQS